MGENTPLLFFPKYKIKSRYIFIVIMDYVDESDVEVLSEAYFTVNDLIFSSKCFKSLLFCRSSQYI